MGVTPTGNIVLCDRCGNHIKGTIHIRNTKTNQAVYLCSNQCLSLMAPKLKKGS